VKGKIAPRTANHWLYRMELLQPTSAILGETSEETSY